MSNAPNANLAKITPLDPRVAGRVLGRWNLILTGSIIFIPMFAVMLLSAMAPLMVAFAILELTSASFDLVLSIVGLVYLSEIFLFVWSLTVVFEWLLDRRLRRRLIHIVDLSTPPLISPFDDQSRFVSLVPRERLQMGYARSAIDVMLLRVDSDGVWMKGDYFGYEIPRASILSAELYPKDADGKQRTGVLINVRTEEGDVELLISYRDLRFRMLRSARHAEAAELAEQINAIASGKELGPTHATAKERPLAVSTNPYAPPVT